MSDKPKADNSISIHDDNTITITTVTPIIFNAISNTNGRGDGGECSIIQTSTSTKTIAAVTNGVEVNNMRMILPVFIQNERKHSQPERQRQIQSSPVKSMRRFSQDSDYLGRQLNVSTKIRKLENYK